MMNANDGSAKDVVMEERKEELAQLEEETAVPLSLQLLPPVMEEEKKKLVLKYTMSIVVGREPDVNYKFMYLFKNVKKTISNRGSATSLSRSYISSMVTSLTTLARSWRSRSRGSSRKLRPNCMRRTRMLWTTLCLR